MSKKGQLTFPRDAGFALKFLLLELPNLLQLIVLFALLAYIQNEYSYTYRKFEDGILIFSGLVITVIVSTYLWWRFERYAREQDPKGKLDVSPLGGVFFVLSGITVACGVYVLANAYADKRVSSMQEELSAGVTIESPRDYDVTVRFPNDLTYWNFDPTRIERYITENGIIVPNAKMGSYLSLHFSEDGNTVRLSCRDGYVMGQTYSATNNPFTLDRTKQHLTYTINHDWELNFLRFTCSKKGK